MQKKHLTHILKGMGMGAADVVPGVSGGTIAFITGIYEKLLESLSNIGFATLKTALKGNIKEAWEKINGTFLTALFIGIAISVISLAKLISFLLEEHPVMIWAFFFGLIFASIFYVAGKIKEWTIGVRLGIVIGTLTAYLLTISPP
ncbi:MAG: DUF368 domain-containing protein, partial [Flavobacteriales bacterium]